MGMMRSKARDRAVAKGQRPQSDMGSGLPQGSAFPSGRMSPTTTSIPRMGGDGIDPRQKKNPTLGGTAKPNVPPIPR